MARIRGSRGADDDAESRAIAKIWIIDFCR
jgi:hypothetical protein